MQKATEEHSRTASRVCIQRPMQNLRESRAYLTYSSDGPPSGVSHEAILSHPLLPLSPKRRVSGGTLAPSSLPLQDQPQLPSSCHLRSGGPLT